MKKKCDIPPYVDDYAYRIDGANILAFGDCEVSTNTKSVRYSGTITTRDKDGVKYIFCEDVDSDCDDDSDNDSDDDTCPDCNGTTRIDDERCDTCSGPSDLHDDDM